MPADLDPYTLDPYTDRRPFDMFNPELAGKKSDIEMMEIGMTDLLNTYNKAGYKYDAVMAMYAFACVFSPPMKL